MYDLARKGEVTEEEMVPRKVVALLSTAVTMLATAVKTIVGTYHSCAYCSCTYFGRTYYGCTHYGCT